MWSQAVLACMLCAVHVHAGIDYTRCEDNYGYGLMIECTPGFVPTALCTSNGEGSCSGSLTQLQCCQETSLLLDEEEEDGAPEDGAEERACSVLTGGPGEYLTCAPGDATLEACTSGGNAACSGAWTRLFCCDDHSQGITSECSWEHGTYGVLVKCPEDTVMTGICSSADSPDCSASGSGSYTGIRCCAIV